MTSNVVHLPRPRSARTAPGSLALFVHVGYNDHREVLDLIETGEQGMFGFVIPAQFIERHSELITEAGRRGFDLILDPKTQPMGLPGGHTKSLAALPWGLERHHNTSDFDGAEGRTKAAQIVEMAVTKGFTQILGPTHLLSGPNDPWLRKDINMMQWTSESIAASKVNLNLIYSLAMPMDVIRRPAERQALISAISDAPCNAIWLKIENFGDGSTGEKTAAYIEACVDFHKRGIPLVGDHVGGLPGLGALAFGAVGGIAHGVTMHQTFRAASWRHPQQRSGGGSTWRIYLPQLDMLVKSVVAEALLGTSTAVRGRVVCRDTHCCPHGVRDMIDHPARHALYQRAREIERLSNTPQGIRVANYMDEHVRQVSDNVAKIASADGLDKALQKSLNKKQKDMSHFRHAMAHLANAKPLDSLAISPLRRAVLDRRGS